MVNQFIQFQSIYRIKHTLVRHILFIYNLQQLVLVINNMMLLLNYILNKYIYLYIYMVTYNDFLVNGCLEVQNRNLALIVSYAAIFEYIINIYIY